MSVDGGSVTGACLFSLHEKNKRQPCKLTQCLTSSFKQFYNYFTSRSVRTTVVLLSNNDVCLFTYCSASSWRGGVSNSKHQSYAHQSYAATERRVRLLYGSGLNSSVRFFAIGVLQCLHFLLLQPTCSLHAGHIFNETFRGVFFNPCFEYKTSINENSVSTSPSPNRTSNSPSSAMFVYQPIPRNKNHLILPTRLPFLLRVDGLRVWHLFCARDRCDRVLFVGKHASTSPTLASSCASLVITRSRRNPKILHSRLHPCTAPLMSFCWVCGMISTMCECGRIHSTCNIPAP